MVGGQDTGTGWRLRQGWVGMGGLGGTGLGSLSSSLPFPAYTMAGMGMGRGKGVAFWEEGRQMAVGSALPHAISLQHARGMHQFTERFWRAGVAQASCLSVTLLPPSLLLMPASSLTWPLLAFSPQPLLPALPTPTHPQPASSPHLLTSCLPSILLQ